MLQLAAVVAFAASACFWKNVGQSANECMLPQAARTLPSPTLRVKYLVDGGSIGRATGWHPPKDTGGRLSARTRWQNDQQFFGITHSDRE